MEMMDRWQKPFGKRNLQEAPKGNTDDTAIEQELAMIASIRTEAGASALRERLAETYKSRPDIFERFTDLLNAKEDALKAEKNRERFSSGN